MRHTLVLLTCCLFSQHGHSGEIFIAALIENDVEVLRGIPFPNSDGDFEVYVRCSAGLSSFAAEYGFLNNRCYVDQQDFPGLAESVEERARSFHVLPARLNNKTQTVLVKYMVIFKKKGTRREISLLPNHGFNSSMKTLGYFSPQKILYPRSRLRCRKCPDAVPIPVYSHVDAQGHVRDITIESQEISEVCRSSLAESFINYRHIPAIDGGEATPSTLVDIVVRGRGGCIFI
ncbi:hypothetical protein [Microbulbifer yueqingensis]|uniref:Uncharacterized protein n=1 Tax=Microbulbifer yueqingensis TaxID=658219 RepID=A0A1G9BUJ1_9GAMM|nr:hypothetical protein [Microbulbifer yueqingensis]SDK43132.1 hypothetical protein SAMN05216212_2372 [Microbulbifer yueqingensis]